MQNWCEHAEKASKYVWQTYRFEDREVLVRVQTWVCPECGCYGSEAELVASPGEKACTAKMAANIKPA